MKFFQSSSKFKINKGLINSEWICEATGDESASFYKLRFASKDFVEGWVKYTDHKNEVLVFSATYEKEKNLLKFRKDDDLFVAVYTKNKLTALIDGEAMNFLRSA
jgi:hypothetical protein